VVAAAIVDDLNDPKLLLAARRKPPSKYAGQWEFPGGKVEPGEDPVAALHRELAEELSVTALLGEEVRSPDGDHWPGVPGISIRLWLARVVVGTPTAEVAHDEVRWLPKHLWHDVPWLAADVPILNVLESRFR
jgi:8-oxo-dGTP diphosphatase